MSDALPQLLLVEPNFVLRRTLAAVAKDMRLADVHESPNLGVAERLAASRSYDIVVLASEAAPDPLDSAAALAALVATSGARRALLLLQQDQAEPATAHPVLRKPVNVKMILKVLAEAQRRLDQPAAPSGA